MTKGLHVSPTVTLPVQVLTESTTIFGRKRSGKSNNAVVLVEEALDLRAQVVVLDPKGDWWGMTSSFDGAAAGYPLVVIGGTHATHGLELNPLAGAIVAEWILDGGYSAIVDLSLIRDADRDRFCAPFLETIRRRKTLTPGPLLIVVDEADELAPQDERERAHIMNAYRSLVWMVKRGGAFGIGTIAITQRPASLAKNITTQSETVITLLVTGSQDLDAVGDALKHHVEGAVKKDRAAALDNLLREIVQLDKGETVIVSAAPGLKGKIHRVAFRRRRTFDSGATPEFGKKVRQPKVVAKVDLEQLGAAMAKSVADAKANDPTTLRADLAAAQKRIGELEKRPEKETTKGVPMLRPGEVTKLERAIAAGAKSSGDIDRMVALISKAGQAMLDSANDVARILTVAAQRRPPIAEPVRTVRPAERAAAPVARVGGSAIRTAPAPAASMPPGNGAARIAKGEHAILRAIAQHEEGVSREQLTVLTGYKKSSRDTYVQRLTSGGLAVIELGQIYSTPAGRQALGPDFEPLPKGDALRAHWLERLPLGERRILEELVAIYPSTMSRDALTEATGYKKSSRDTYLQRLSSRRLVDVTGRDGIRASEILFEGVA